MTNKLKIVLGHKTGHNGPTLSNLLTDNSGPTRYRSDPLLTIFKRPDPLYPMGTQPIVHL